MGVDFKTFKDLKIVSGKINIKELRENIKIHYIAIKCLRMIQCSVGVNHICILAT